NDSFARRRSSDLGVPGTDPACAGDKTYTFTYTDCANETYTWVYRYQVAAPVVTMPDAITTPVACLSEATMPTPRPVNDNCGRPLSVSAGVPGTDPACAGDKTYTFTYTDCANETYTWVYTYQVGGAAGRERDAITTPVACLAEATRPPAPPRKDIRSRPVMESDGAHR